MIAMTRLSVFISHVEHAMQVLCNNYQENDNMNVSRIDNGRLLNGSAEIIKFQNGRPGQPGDHQRD